MSNKLRYCILCKRYDGRARRSSYTRIYTAEREARLREGYRRRYNGQEFDQPLLKQLVHKKCYNKIVQCLPSIDESISSNNDISIPIEENQDDNDEAKDQTLLVQSRSSASIPSNVKNSLERSQRVCVVCNSYKYTTNNRIKQVVSNFMANKLAEGFLYRYKRPYGKSLLDAYIHDACYRKLYASYRYHPSRRCQNINNLQNQQQYMSQSPHKTRSHSNINKSTLRFQEYISEITADDETVDLSIEDLFSKPFSMSVATSNPNIELGARSCLFRPCIERLTPEEIEFYTKRQKINEENTLISDQLPIVQSFIMQTPTTNDSMIYSNQVNNANDVNTNEQNTSSPSHSTFKKQQKIRTSAEIRHRYSKPPPLSKPANPLTHDHIYTPTTHSKKAPDNLENLYNWLIEQLKSSGNPLTMNEVLTKYRELTKEDINTTTTTTRENLCRSRLRNHLEKFYPNQFVFVVPNKHDGTYIALNNIEHYVRFAIKNVQQEKEKVTETSILSSVIIPSTSTAADYKRETCEIIMNAIRKIRLYIRDPKQVNSPPSLFMQNLIGLITTSEKKFDKISHQYDFYRMIDENLFDNGNEIKSNKLDKNLRNMSLASDLISARHDNQISQKHFLLADEFAKEKFHCTPKQVITLLNHYGHTCSYKSYRKIKKLRQRMINELGENFLADEEKSSDSDLDLIEL